MILGKLSERSYVFSFQKVGLKGAMSHTAYVREEALHLENVRQLFQVLRVIQYQEFIGFYLRFRVYSHNKTGRRKYSSIGAKTRKELYYKRRFAAKNRPDFLNPIWRTVEKINRQKSCTCAGRDIAP